MVGEMARDLVGLAVLVGIVVSAQACGFAFG